MSVPATDWIDVVSFRVRPDEYVTPHGQLWINCGGDQVGGQFRIEARDSTLTETYKCWGPWPFDTLDQPDPKCRPITGVPGFSPRGPYAREDQYLVGCVRGVEWTDLPDNLSVWCRCHVRDDLGGSYHDDLELTREGISRPTDSRHVGRETPEEPETPETTASDPALSDDDLRAVYADHFESDSPPGPTRSELEEVTGIRTL